MTEQMQQNITLDDVRSATKDTDINSTNASKIRSTLGRGSLSTIQKYLDLIRAEQAQATQTALREVPKAPGDVLQSIWIAAWSAAQAHTASALADALTRCTALERERDIALQDAYAAHAATDTAAQMLNAERTSNQAVIKERDAALSKQTALQKEIDALLHELELKEAKIKSLQSENDLLVSNLADLRASLKK